MVSLVQKHSDSYTSTLWVKGEPCISYIKLEKSRSVKFGTALSIGDYQRNINPGISGRDADKILSAEAGEHYVSLVRLFNKHGIATTPLPTYYWVTLTCPQKDLEKAMDVLGWDAENKQKVMDLSGFPAPV